jgi:hypothetical protein
MKMWNLTCSRVLILCQLARTPQRRGHNIRAHKLLLRVVADSHLQGSCQQIAEMADEVDWLPVLQKVFKDYGTQLRRSKVKRAPQLAACSLNSC